MPPHDHNPPIIHNLHDGIPRYISNELSADSLDGSPIDAHMRKEASRGRAVWKAGTNDYLDGLRALPEIRPIPWMPGKELSPEKSTQSARTQTRGAFLLVTRGRVNSPPCSHCATGVGRFSQCISLDQWFHGACATCQMGTRGNLCTIRTDATEVKDKPNPESPQHSIPVESPHPDSSLKRKRALTGNRSGIGASIAPRPIVEATRGPRASTSTMATAPPKPYISPYVPASGSTIQSPDLHGPIYSTPNAVPPSTNNGMWDPSSSLVNYIYKRPDVLNVMNRPQIISQTQNNVPSRPNQRPSYSQSAEVGRSRNEDQDSDSLSPSAQLLEPQHVSRGQIIDYNRNSQPQSGKDDGMAVIDSLPRRKQKQIYGIIGGIQSGIRNVRQQAEGLQKQLDLLQAALGIDADENEPEAD